MHKFTWLLPYVKESAQNLLEALPRVRLLAVRVVSGDAASLGGGVEAAHCSGCAECCLQAGPAQKAQGLTPEPASSEGPLLKSAQLDKNGRRRASPFVLRDLYHSFISLLPCNLKDL